MLQIVNFFWQICLLRQSPEGLPSSKFSTGAILLAYLAIALGVALGFAMTVSAEGSLEMLTSIRRLWLVCAGFYLLEFLIFWKRYPRNQPSIAAYKNGR